MQQQPDTPPEYIEAPPFSPAQRQQQKFAAIPARYRNSREQQQHVVDPETTPSPPPVVVGATHVPGPSSTRSCDTESSIAQEHNSSTGGRSAPGGHLPMNFPGEINFPVGAAVVAEATLVDDSANSSSRVLHERIQNAHVCRLSQAYQQQQQQHRAAAATNFDVGSVSVSSSHEPPDSHHESSWTKHSSTAAGDENSSTSSYSHSLSRPRSRLAVQAEDFIRCLHISDRRYNLTKYKSVFVGSETVDSLLYRGVVSTREEAVELGRKLAKELRLFSHVCSQKHEFKDEFLFYRLRNDGLVELPKGGSLTPALKMQLQDKVDLFREVVEVKTRTHRMHKYKSVFVGTEAVDRLVYAGFADTRFEAVQLGRLIAKEFGLFAHVKNEHPFADEHLFYRYKALHSANCPCPKCYGQSLEATDICSYIDGSSIGGGSSKYTELSSRTARKIKEGKVDV